jgi:hypothetical protein
VRVPRNVFTARVLGVIAVVTAPLFVVYGWWVLAASAILAGAAAVAVPPAHGHGGPGPLRRVLRAANRRLHRHSWRPGGY